MKRRDVLKAACLAPLALVASTGSLQTLAAAVSRSMAAVRGASRVRPGQPGWPSVAQWDELNAQTGGSLQKLSSPFVSCAGTADPVCAEAVANLKNPFYIGDQAALTQTSGWADAWTSEPSAYAVAARHTQDVVAAVNFAREHHLRLVVKGGGHSYQGTSDAPDSLLVWTRHMNTITMHDAFVAQGSMSPPQPAVSVGAGAMWIDAYDAVTTKGGRYVQGGGCTTVGVAGLVQSGGFGSFSKNFGSAASNLIEAEVVTADGKVHVVNAVKEPELYWAIKGGGGGSIGVVTRLTLRTHDLPDVFGVVFGTIYATTPASYRALVAKAMSFYRDALFNPHWGEQMSLREGNRLNVSMLFQGISQAEAEATWKPFIDWVEARPEYVVSEALKATALPARHFWDADFFREHAPGFIVADTRPNAPRNHVLWAGDRGQVGWFIHAYESAWLPESLLQGSQDALVDALVAVSVKWGVELHFNKGLAGGTPEMRKASRDTATNPAMADAFALAIIGAGGDPAYPGLPGAKTDLPRARRERKRVGEAMDELLRVAPGAGAYVSESSYFQKDWQQAYWGSNYARLAAAKRRYDPDGLFFVHHGVGSEVWSADGFTRTGGLF
ncbi:FAD/FMN-containing dehydrogenase [Luteibacter sp. Sphag1AF]|uniref:FAD-binding oxidoreductase n=1 Tax=Luteibacter sp. Sphag1AF TaxID=2587031 RepID=UPI00162303F0|nr:FAD-binding oxidoreductase [Luteibacter sp. Sphag1AF]MBB3228036.1 FAD/FMN-containing dehydrogenase [Luteibacter sp. Sphag1AF]